MAEKTFVHIDPAHKPADMPECGATDGLCPKCGAVLQQGFGLAGGGFGVYEYCDSDECNAVVTKTELDE
jgi:hypothetical protein